jgi:hypothetical protein
MDWEGKDYYFANGDAAFLKQAVCGKKAGDTCIVRCAICGSESNAAYTPHWKDGCLCKLRLRMSFCTSCGRWVCDDCFIAYSDTGAELCCCVDCAREMGGNGARTVSGKPI